MKMTAGLRGINDHTKHEPDIQKIPTSLRPCKWEPYRHDIEWWDGETILAAVPVRDKPDGWHYEFTVVSIRCDVDGVDAICNGETWDWDVGDIDFFVRISR